MKRIITLALCLLLVLSMVSCAPKEEASSLQVGFGREDITPPYSMPMRGYGNPNERWSLNVLDPLYSTCIAFRDGDGNTVLLFHNDLCSTPATVFTFVRKEISDVTGIPVDNIMVSATHTHSGPEQSIDDPIVEIYNDFVEEKMVLAAQAALADLKNAEMYTATTTLKNANFVRHYRMDDGSVVGDNFGDPTGKRYVSHVKDADNEMQLIRFKRDGGKDVVLVNWQTHPLRTGGATLSDISADVVGSMRMALEPQMDCFMAYFSGGSGNIDPSSRILDENIYPDYIDQGNAMAQEAIMACDRMTKQETGKVQILRNDMEIYVDKDPVRILAYAFSIGDVAFTTHPYEMFDTNGKFVKDNSPFEMTFIVTLANNVSGYIAAEWAYEYGGYEVEYVGYNKGSAEDLADGYVEMLKQLHGTRK